MQVQSEKLLSTVGGKSQHPPVPSRSQLESSGFVPGSGQAAHTLTVSCLEILRPPGDCVPSRGLSEDEIPKEETISSLLDPQLSPQDPTRALRPLEREALSAPPRLPPPHGEAPSHLAGVPPLLAPPALCDSSFLEEKPGTEGGNICH